MSLYQFTFYSAKFLICVYSRDSMSRSKLVSTVTRLLLSDGVYLDKEWDSNAFTDEEF